MLVRLLYASRTTPSVNAEAIASILKKSKAHNAEAGITGVLCAKEPCAVRTAPGLPRSKATAKR